MSNLHCQQISESDYNRLIRDNPKVHHPIEQSFTWGEFQSKIPNRICPGSYVVLNYDDSVAYFTPVLMRQRGHSYIWINQGPVILDEFDEINKTIVDFLAQENKIDFIRLHSKNQLDGYEQPMTHVIDRTAVVDLTKSDEDLLNDMKQSGRRALRKAQNNDLDVRLLSLTNAINSLDELYEILKETASRDDFGHHPKSVYKDMLETLGDNAGMYVVKHQNKIIAWALTTTYLDHGIYYYGASNATARDLSAPYKLHYDIMRELKRKGIKKYDFLGIASANFPELAGVTQFKLRFGGDETDYVPIYDAPLNRLKYKQIKTLKAIKSKLRR